MNTEASAPGALSLTFEERVALASRLGTSAAYLYQCLTNRRQLDERDAVLAEMLSGGKVRRWQLRQADWWRVWPELIGADGAPPVPESTQEVRDAA